MLSSSGIDSPGLFKDHNPIGALITGSRGMRCKEHRKTWLGIIWKFYSSTSMIGRNLNCHGSVIMTENCKVITDGVVNNVYIGSVAKRLVGLRRHSRDDYAPSLFERRFLF